MQTKNKVNKSGFTLLELLIVVLIIGILSSVALPMYKKAAERSKATEALSTLTAVAKSEHDFFLTKNKYTQDFADLDITLTDKNGNKADDESFQTTFYDYELLDSGILATRTNKEYSLYKDYELQQIMCAPSEHYVCDNLGGFTKEPCQEAKFAWANRNSTCYADNGTRCKDLYGESMWNGKFCGYTNTANKTLNEGMECRSSSWGSCGKTIINNGAVCVGNSSDSCWESKIYSGGVCEGKNLRSCKDSTIESGGVCHATYAGAASCNNVTIKDGGICNAEGTGVYGGGCYESTIESGGVCNANVSGSWTCGGSTIKSGGVCNAIGYDTCYGVKIEAGGICNSKASWACNGATVYSGAICKGTTQYACVGSTIKEGGECWAEAEGACSSKIYNWERNMTYEGSGKTSGCCRGTYCPSDAPRCECPNHEQKDSSGNCITA